MRTTCIALCLTLAAGVLPSCGPGDTKTAPGQKRVVSCSPATTRMLFDMGFGEQVVGVTKFCKLPAGQTRPRIVDALSVNTEAMLAVRPDVIFSQVDPSKFRGVTDADPHVKIVHLSIESLGDIPKAMLAIGRELGREQAARKKTDEFEATVEAVRRSVAHLAKKRVAFVMGTARPTAAGAGTFVSDMITAAGGVNVGSEIPGPTIWKPTQAEEIIRVRPEVLLCQISPGKEADARNYWLQWKDIPAAMAGQVYVVSDPAWSIPSPHLADLLPKLAKMIHPGLPPASQPSTASGRRPITGGGGS